MIQTDPRSPSLARLARIGAAVLCATTIAACGGGDADTADHVADGRDSALKFAQCMREHGVDMPDPKFDANGGMAVTLTSGAKSGNTEADMDNAQKACGKYMEDVGSGKPLDAAAQAKLQDAMLAHARCMRKHGIDMPDPEFSTSGGRMTSKVTRGGRGGPSQDGPDSPRFKAADKACRPLLEGAGPGGSTPASMATAVPGPGR